MKNLIIIALMLFIVPMACASRGKMFEMGDSCQSVIDTGAIQETSIVGNIIYIKYSYSTKFNQYRYTNNARAQQKYRVLVQEVKDYSKDKCLRYGGGKACYMR